MKLYCNLAKQAVEKYIRKGEILNIPKKLPAEFKKKAGVFVTIYKTGKLRGCIGTYLPTKKNLAQEIIDNAIMAATKDWRFPPISEVELPNIECEVSVLSEPKLVKDIKELNPKKFGILIKGQTSGKSALLLPDLDGLNTVEKQLFACCQKAGIDLEMESISIFSFQTKRY